MIFDSKSLHDAVTQQLKDADIPDDHKNALSLIATTAGVKAVLSTKVGSHWQVDTVLNWSAPEKKIEGGVQVKATWGT